MGAGQGGAQGQAQVQRVIGGQVHLFESGCGIAHPGLSQLLAHAHKRIQRAHRFLEDHGHGFPAQGADAGIACADYLVAIHGDGAARAHPIGQKPHDGQRSERFAGAGFTNDTELLAGRELEVKRSHKGSGGPGGGDGQVIYVEQAHRADPFRRGSRRSRRASPSRLKPSTVAAMARPGQKACRGAVPRSDWESCSIRPQEAAGGAVPRPR